MAGVGGTALSSQHGTWEADKDDDDGDELEASLGV